MAEFPGVARSLALFGLSKYVVIPMAAAAVWVIVVQGTYSSVEKIFLVDMSTRAFNIIAWATVGVMIGLTFAIATQR